MLYTMLYNMLYTMLYTNLCTIQYTNKKTSKREIFCLSNFHKYYRVNPFSVKICGWGIGNLWKFSTELKIFFSINSSLKIFILCTLQDVIEPPSVITFPMNTCWSCEDLVQWISLLGNCGFKTQLGCHRDVDNKTVCGWSPHDSGSMNHIITESRNLISSPVYHLGHLLELSWV